MISLAVPAATGTEMDSSTLQLPCWSGKRARPVRVRSPMAST